MNCFNCSSFGSYAFDFAFRQPNETIVHHPLSSSKNQQTRKSSTFKPEQRTNFDDVRLDDTNHSKRLGNDKINRDELHRHDSDANEDKPDSAWLLMRESENLTVRYWYNMIHD